MRVLVMGAGALGGYYGGLLSRAGHEVSFVLRGRRLEAARRDGLRVVSVASGDFTVPGRFVASPAEAGVSDLVLFCVKSFDTRPAAEALRPCLGPETAVLTLQNGIDNEDVLVEVLGERCVLGGAARIEATLADDGTVRQLSRFHRVDFGKWPTGSSELARRLWEDFRAAGIDAHLTEDARLEVWRKFTFLCCSSGITAATGCSMGQMVALPETRDLLKRALEEVQALARAEGVGLPEDIVDRSLEGVAALPYAMRSSLQRDLERGRPLEIDHLSGAVVRHGRLHGVDTPVHQTLWACVKARGAFRNE